MGFQQNLICDYLHFESSFDGIHADYPKTTANVFLIDVPYDVYVYENSYYVIGTKILSAIS